MSDIIAAELEARHAEAQRAFAARDIGAYRAIFSPALAYRQPGGKVIGRDTFVGQVGVQFHRMSRVASAYTREALTVADDEATESLTQTAALQATAFGILHRSWDLHRRGE